MGNDEFKFANLLRRGAQSQGPSQTRAGGDTICFRSSTGAASRRSRLPASRHLEGRLEQS